MSDKQTEMIGALRDLTTEIRQLREDFNPQIRTSKILELKAEEDRKADEAIMKAHQKRLDRKKLETQLKECV